MSILHFLGAMWHNHTFGYGRRGLSHGVLLLLLYHHRCPVTIVVTLSLSASHYVHLMVA
jgi:hypothetical protein